MSIQYDLEFDDMDGVEWAEMLNCDNETILLENCVNSIEEFNIYYKLGEYDAFFKKIKYIVFDCANGEEWYDYNLDRVLDWINECPTNTVTTIKTGLFKRNENEYIVGLINA